MVTLNLTIIDTLSASVTVAGNTLTAQPAGGTYQWLDCDNNYSAITGETNQSFTATTNGIYAVEVTVTPCVDTSNCHAVSIVGLEEGFINQLNLYPNPTTGMLWVVGVSGIVSVYDVYGRLVLTTESNELDLSTSADGIYFLHLVDNKGSLYVGRVVKE